MPAPPTAFVTFPERVPAVIAVKVMPLLVCPLTVTVTGPVVTPLGTVAVILPLDHELATAARPLNRTALVPWLAPKFDPVMMTELPAAPVVMESDAMDGAGVTVNVVPLLFVPPVVTTRGPVVAPGGTGT
jgi:hypothetical protein